MNSEIDVVVKKKRGRKPKEKKEEEVKIPKKRGRKPTGKILSMKTSELSTLENDENCIIAHIPLSNKIIEKIEEKNKLEKNISNEEPVAETESDTETSINELSFENNSFGKNKSEFHDKYIVHLEDQIKSLKLKVKDLEENKNSEIFFSGYSVEKLNSKIFKNEDDNYILSNNCNYLCWWCCHKFNNTPFPLPDKYYNNKFYVFGNFCSPSCACAYNVDMNDHKLWERNSLISKLYNELTGEALDFISPSPPRQIIDSFGGTISISEYREKINIKTSYSSRFIIPPMVPLMTLIEESYKDRNKYKWETKVNISKYNNLQKNIKIKRTTNNEKENNLEKIMGLKKIKINELV